MKRYWWIPLLAAALGTALHFFYDWFSQSFGGGNCPSGGKRVGASEAAVLALACRLPAQPQPAAKLLGRGMRRIAGHAAASSGHILYIGLRLQLVWPGIGHRFILPDHRLWIPDLVPGLAPSRRRPFGRGKCACWLASGGASLLILSMAPLDRPIFR